MSSVFQNSVLQSHQCAACIWLLMQGVLAPSFSDNPNVPFSLEWSLNLPCYPHWPHHGKSSTFKIVIDSSFPSLFEALSRSKWQVFLGSKLSASIDHLRAKFGQAFWCTLPSVSESSLCNPGSLWISSTPLLSTVYLPLEEKPDFPIKL